jgi:peptidoglycan/xylan/chitin deacetylase (PgdA/CDA1 family)/SAM-dependent methyltransferase
LKLEPNSAIEMNSRRSSQRTAPAIVSFYHDIEQGLDSGAHPERCRQVVKEFLALERKYNVRATYNVVGKIFVDQPDLIDWITRDGHEVAFHSYDHRPDWKPCHSSSQIDLCRRLSPSIRGYRSPRSEIDRAGVQRLWEKGFLWNAEGDPRHEPYFIHGGLVRLPIATDDWPLHRGEVSGEEYLQRFSGLLRERPYVAVGFHDSVTSLAPAERLPIWERLLQIAAEAQARTVTFSEAADLFRRAAVARYYTQRAKDWNRETRILYRTRRFQELLKDEVEKLSKPVIADLGSGGGVLSAPLKERAATIYCVDNAPGMVAEIDLSGCIQSRLGEVTDSQLPDHSVDVVICARIIEYLYWPERLADEIKRIGKNGASYFVTFPAFRGQPPSNDGPPPDRIRRHFMPEQIRRWAMPIGHGRLIGVQYESSEPSDPETERRYRMLEKDPPPQTLPTNWVYIGTVEHDDGAGAHGRTLPISAARFHFPSERSEQIKGWLRHAAAWLPRPLRRIGRWVLGPL